MGFGTLAMRIHAVGTAATQTARKIRRMQTSTQAGLEAIRKKNLELLQRLLKEGDQNVVQAIQDLVFQWQNVAAGGMANFAARDRAMKYIHDFAPELFGQINWNTLERQLSSGKTFDEAVKAALAAEASQTLPSSTFAIGGSATTGTRANFNLSFGTGAPGASLAEQIAFLVAQQNAAANDEIKALYQKEIDALKQKLDALPNVLAPTVSKAVLTGMQQPSAKDLYLTGRLR